MPANPRRDQSESTFTRHTSSLFSTTVFFLIYHPTAIAIITIIAIIIFGLFSLVSISLS